MERAKLTVTAFKTRDEKIEMVRDIAGQVAGARDAQTWSYRGLVLRKTDTGRSRGGSTLMVESQDGHEYTEFDIIDNRTADIIDLLEEIRSKTIGAQAAAEAV